METTEKGTLPLALVNVLGQKDVPTCSPGAVCMHCVTPAEYAEYERFKTQHQREGFAEVMAEYLRTVP